MKDHSFIKTNIEYIENKMATLFTFFASAEDVFLQTEG